MTAAASHFDPQKRLECLKAKKDTVCACNYEAQGRTRGYVHVYTYTYIIYIPNLGFSIAVFDQEREQGRFRGSSEGASREHWGSTRGHGGVARE